MPFEYNDIHSDFINLNATQSIHLLSDNIFINDVNIVTSLKQLGHANDAANTNTLSRIGQLELNIRTVLTNYLNLNENIRAHISNLDREVKSIKDTMLLNKSTLDTKFSDNNTLHTKINTVELVSNQLKENVKGYMESVDNITKKLKFTESNQVDIMSVITRVIKLEHTNKELVEINESLRKKMDENTNSIQELSCKLEEAIANVSKSTSNDVVEINDNTQPSPQLSRAKSTTGRKNK